MGCCGGSSRPPIRGPSVAPRSGRGPTSHPSGPTTQPPLQFLGPRPATVIGPVTGRRYRVLPSTPIAVDPRDQRGLLATPHFTQRSNRP